jgi:hypothetical protein
MRLGKRQATARGLILHVLAPRKHGFDDGPPSVTGQPAPIPGRRVDGGPSPLDRDYSCFRHEVMRKIIAASILDKLNN